MQLNRKGNRIELFGNVEIQKDEEELKEILNLIDEEYLVVIIDIHDTESISTNFIRCLKEFQETRGIKIRTRVYSKDLFEMIQDLKLDNILRPILNFKKM